MLKEPIGPKAPDRLPYTTSDFPLPLPKKEKRATYTRAKPTGILAVRGKEEGIVVALAAEGIETKDIAALLNLSPQRVGGLKRNGFKDIKKLQSLNSTEAKQAWILKNFGVTETDYKIKENK